MRKYIGYALEKTKSPEQEARKIASLYAHRSNGGIHLDIVADEHDCPQINLAFDHFGTMTKTTFYLASEGLRDFGMLFLEAAQYDYAGWAPLHGKTPHSPGLNPESMDSEHRKYRFEISEEDLLRRHDLLRAELDRVEAQLAQVVDPDVSG